MNRTENCWRPDESKTRRRNVLFGEDSEVTSMLAETISIGDELTSGERLDTNCQWLSRRLGELGIRVLYHTTVGDDLEANTEVFRHAARRADLVISTGGLGPTADDLTRHALAAAAGAELILDPTALEHLHNLFARRKRAMPERNRVQAMFPAGSRIVPNPHGSAPGIDIDLPRLDAPPARVFALPGVPAEMFEMWEQTVAPALQALLGDRRRAIRSHTIKCFGVGESDLEAMLPDLISRGREPAVGITVSKATISLRIVAEADSNEQCQRQIAATTEVIQRCLGQLVFGEGDDELQHAVVKLLTARRKTLATAESSSGGLMASWLSEADPDGNIFRGGLVRRDAWALTADATGRLAQDARRNVPADIGLALSGFPAGDSPRGAPGDIFVACASRDGLQSASFPFTGHPEILKVRAVKQALNFLRLAILDGILQAERAPGI